MTRASVPDVAQVTVIPADEGLAEFRKYSGFGAALDALKSNPLPNVLHVVPRRDASGAAGVWSRCAAISPPGRKSTSCSSTRSGCCASTPFSRCCGAWSLIAAVLLGAGVLAVVGNTIRLEILNRRAEIEVTKLVGGSNAFVRRPFLYTGLLYGLGGAALAWIILEAAVLVLDQPVATLAQLYGSRYALAGPFGAGARCAVRRRGGARLAGRVDLRPAASAQHRAACVVWQCYGAPPCA